MIFKVQNLSKKYSENYKFNMPDLRVGTLDHLLTASEDLERLEATVENVVSKVVQAFVDIHEQKQESVDDYFLVQNTPIPEFLSRFQWDLTKYATRQTMKGIQEHVERTMASIEIETKTLHSEFVAARSELTALERHGKGPLLTRDISSFVRKEDFVTGSEHLITVLVVVPKVNFHEWYNSYERLDDEVVPRSTNLLYDDTDFGLFNVTLFKRHLHDFKEKAKEMRFYVKDFEFNQERIDRDRQHLTVLRQKKGTLVGPLFRALRINFSECYTSYIHVKTMRVFVECALRYGLPANYLGLIMVVPKKNVKKLRELMFKEFAYLDGSLPIGDKEVEDKQNSQALNSTDYFPYVSSKVNVEPADFKRS